MSRVFKTRTFNRWMRKSGLSDQRLRAAVTEMERGLIDADLGGPCGQETDCLAGARKERQRPHPGRHAPQGTLIFLFGFGKNERANIAADELAALQEIARTLLALNDTQVAAAIAAGELLEIRHDYETQEPHP